MSDKSDQLSPRRRPSQERSRDRVERILDATAGLLSEMPVEKITTAAIADKAGVPIGSVYQYFPNKLAVLAQLARRVMEEVDLKTASLIAEDFGVLPWDQAIDRAIDATMQGYSEQPGYIQLLLSIRPIDNSRTIEIYSQKKGRSARVPSLRRGRDTLAALFGHKIDQGLHQFEIRPAAQHPSLALLMHQARIHQMGNVVRKGRGRNVEVLLKVADRQSRSAGFDQQTKHLEPGRIAQLIETACRLKSFHSAMRDEFPSPVNYISRIIEI